MRGDHRILERGARGWPSRLEHLPDPPERLWLAGSTAPGRGPAVAVVGARRASHVGLEVARELGRGLAALGVTLISGMALGIDGAAHAGALDGGGATIAVLGCGVDVCYPPRHHALRERILARGCLVSEDPPGSEPLAWRFPRRNRLIAALCVAVVVVEAGDRSGALSTARHAADLGREILAVPGSVASESTRGSNRLIRDGATPLLGLEDLVVAVPGLGAPAVEAAARPPIGAGAGRQASASSTRQRLLDLVAGGPVHPDRVAAELSLGASALNRLITDLEIAGRLISLPTGELVASPEGAAGGWSGAVRV